MLKTSEQFNKDSFEWQVWGKVQVVTWLHFPQKSQAQMCSQAMGWVTYLAVSLFCCPWEKRRMRDTAEWRWGVDCVSCPWRHTKQTRVTCEGMDRTALKTGIGHLLGREKLSLTELSHICTTSDTIPLQPRSTHVFSPVYTMLQASFLLPQARASFHFTKAHCHICRFLLLASGVISMCTALEMCGCLCSTDRISSFPLPWPMLPWCCILVRAYLFSCPFPLFPTVLAECFQQDTEQAYTWSFSRHLSNFNLSPSPVFFMMYSTP